MDTRVLTLGLGIGLGLSCGLAALSGAPRAEGAALSDRVIKKLDKRLARSDARAGRKGVVEGGFRSAVVVDNVHPEGHAKVRVKFPWLDESETSEWIRVSQPHAATGFFLPEIDDEVIVAFEQGDVRRPIVIGSLWNDAQPPPR